MLKSIFTWWNSATLGIRFTIARRGVFVGEDDYGNRYYEARDASDSYDDHRRRWVIYRGYAEASKVPAEWHGWLHYTFDDSPATTPLKRRAPAQPHRHDLGLAAEGLDQPRRRAAGGQRRLRGLEARLNRHARLALGLAAGAAIAAAAGLTVLAQPAGNDTGAPPDAGPPLEAPPPDLNPPDASAPSETIARTPRAATNSLSAKPAPPKPPPPPPTPPPPVRAPTAVLQALDKVTAQTLRFAAPVGQPVRYKNLVFTVKSCETSGIGQAEPQSQAYLVIDFAPLASGGVAPPPPREVFKGWMFANSPSLNPFHHPTYDAWLIACMDKPPPG